MNARSEPPRRRVGLPENIFLVGLMGAGKTSVGRVLAKRLHKSFYDSDQEIERATGVKIPMIFEIEGEAGFRAREARILADLVRRKNIVLATGGGAVLFEENRRLLTEHGTVIYLHAAVCNLWERTRHDKNRPLLQAGDAMAKLQALFAERDPLYREIADVIIDTGSQSVGNLAHKVEQRLAQFGRRSHEAGSGLPTG